MTAKRLGTRLAAALRKAPAKAGASVMARWAEQLRRDIETFLRRHVPADLRDACRERFADNTNETFASWRQSPFARWAPPMAADYQFPRALVEFLLDPPHRVWMGFTCGACGLSAPLYSEYAPDRPENLNPFPRCPACGGRTSSAAHYRPDSAAEVAT